MTHEFNIAGVGLLLLLTVVALVALEPCARHDAEHAAKAITYDLERGATGLLERGVQLTLNRPDPRPSEARKQLCTGINVCPVRKPGARQVS